MTVQKLTIQVGSPHTRTVSSTASGTFFGLNLPPGLTLSTGGVISGTPTTPGTYASTVFCVSKKEVGVAVIDYTVIPVPVPVITSSDDEIRETGVSTTYQVTATSALPILSYAASNLFSGLGINPTTGLISGTPSTNVSEDALIKIISRLSVTSDAGIGQRDVLFRFQQRPVITSSLNTLSLLVGSAMTPYTITASKSPISFSASGLPSGTTVNPSTGTISGTPAGLTGGAYPVSLSADNGQLVGSAVLPVEVFQAPVITSSLTSTAPYLQNYNYQITASAYPSPSSYAAVNLPSGFTLNSSTGLITGQVSGPPYSNATNPPTPISVTLSATNTVGVGNAALALSVNGVPSNMGQVRKIGSTYFIVSAPPGAGPWFSYTSTDKINWTKNTINSRPTNAFVGIVYTGSEWVYLATIPVGVQTLSTSDGVNWNYAVSTISPTSASFAQGNNCHYFASAGRYLILSGNVGLWSSNKLHWFDIPGIPFNSLLSAGASINGVVVRTGSGNFTGTNAAVSSDGITWSYFNIGGGGPLNSAVAGGGIFIVGEVPPAGSTTSTYYRSTNGSSWTTHTFPIGLSFFDFKYINGRFWGAGYSSTDGINWTNSIPFATNVPSTIVDYQRSFIESVDDGISGEVAATDQGSPFFYPVKTYISNSARDTWTSSNFITT